MSRRITQTVDIAAPARLVWQAFGRLEDWPGWFPALSSVDRLGGGPFRVGETFTLNLLFRGYGSRVEVTVAESSAQRVRWLGRSFGVTGDHAFFVEALGEDRSRFGSDEIFSGLPVALMPRALFSALTAEVMAGLVRFRSLVEIAPLHP